MPESTFTIRSPVPAAGSAICATGSRPPSPVPTSRRGRSLNPRVVQLDARDPCGYPPGPFTIICSPVYVNKRLADYPNGPTPATKIQRRRDYALTLRRPLHRDNLARLTGRRSKVDAYWQAHRDAVTHWGDRVIVNVDYPIWAGWARLLDVYGYAVDRPILVKTQRYRGLANDQVRAEHEAVLMAVRTNHPSPAALTPPSPARTSTRGGW
jgi:hypothetical protein